MSYIRPISSSVAHQSVLLRTVATKRILPASNNIILSQYRSISTSKSKHVQVKRIDPAQRQMPPMMKSGASLGMIGALVAGSLAGYYFYSNTKQVPGVKDPNAWKRVDYEAVYHDITELLDDPDFDDGSYGPILCRLAWHSSGSFDKVSHTGGSNGGTMRFNPEASHVGNKGLDIARARLLPLKEKYRDISYADLYTLGGVVAVQQAGGPTIPWRPGRLDADPGKMVTPDGRLPDGAQGSMHVRDVFYRMGFNDREIVALVGGGHALGRCHKDRSGFDGPWNHSPIDFTNFFFTELMEQEWEPRKWDGAFQYTDKATHSLMMMPADMALKTDPIFRKYSELYAKDQDALFNDFAPAFAKLLELGVKFPIDSPVYHFKTLE